MNGTTATDRVAICLPEARLELGLSQRQLSVLAGVSRYTIARVERGGRVDPAQLVRLGATLMVLDTYGPPPFEDVVAALPTLKQPPCVTLKQPPRLTLGQPPLPNEEWVA